MSLQTKKTKVVRQKCLAEKIVIVDGQPGCGKTMLSPIIASLDRVELVSYAFEIEFICRLHSLDKIDDDAAIAMVRMEKPSMRVTLNMLISLINPLKNGWGNILRG